MVADKKENNLVVQITELTKDVCWLKNEVKDIKEQVFNHLPSQINSLKDRVSFGLLIGIVGVFIIQIILRFFSL